MRVTGSVSSRDSQLWISASRASVSSMRELRVFRPASLRRAIIMPPFMLRSSPFWIILVTLGSIMPAARAEDPPCPSQSASLALPTAAAAATRAAAAAAAAHGKSADGGPIDVTADESDVGEDTDHLQGHA